MSYLGVQEYDILQISRDEGKTWEDLCTLREKWEFTMASEYVNHPDMVARRSHGFYPPNVQFRVIRNDAIVTLPPYL